MSIECVLTILYVCISSDTSSLSTNSGLSFYSVATVDPGAKVEVFSGDSFDTPDWRRMRTACSNGVCIYYYKECKEGGTEVSCEYFFSQPGWLGNGNVRITVDSRSLNAIESSIGIITRSGWRSGVIRLDQFLASGESQGPPLCDRRSSQQECWPTPSLDRKD
jgi:hypothetical protein